MPTLPPLPAPLADELGRPGGAARVLGLLVHAGWEVDLVAGDAYGTCRLTARRGSRAVEEQGELARVVGAVVVACMRPPAGGPGATDLRRDERGSAARA